MRADRIRLRPEAEFDLDVAFGWYEARQAGLGIAFLAAIEVALDSIAHNPLRYAEVSAGARRALTRRFPFAIIVLPGTRFVTILAVVHQAQDPLRWLDRFG